MRNVRENKMPLRPPFVRGRRKAGSLWQALCASDSAQAGAWTRRHAPISMQTENAPHGTPEKAMRGASC